jgi:flagellar hook-associated protein 3 FlgL
MRITQEAIFRRVMGGLSFNFDKMIRAQEQVSSGRRILRPSDDPVGTARALGFQRRIAGAERYLNAISSGLTLVDSGAGQLETGSGILTDARELLIQGMNGTLAQNDRESLASEIELLRSQMIEVANSRSADRYLFGGTLSGAASRAWTTWATTTSSRSASAWASRSR